MSAMRRWGIMVLTGAALALPDVLPADAADYAPLYQTTRSKRVHVVRERYRDAHCRTGWWQHVKYGENFPRWETRCFVGRRYSR